MALSTPLSNAERYAPLAVRSQLTARRRDVAGVVARIALFLALAFTLLVLGVLLVDVVRDGWGVLTDRFDSFVSDGLRSQPEEAGIQQGLRGSFWIGIFTIFLAFPIGIGAALYLEEYARDTWFTRFINVNIRNLAGVPSIVYGILGFAIFVKSFGSLTGGRSVIAAGVTLAILVLPIVVITSAEAIRAVPSTLREGGYGLGATRAEIVRTQVLPAAAPGILTGTVLSLSRALGEAAPLILVGAVTGFLGSTPGLTDVSSLKDRFTAMPMVITTFAQKPQEGFREDTAAAIVILLGVVLVFNSVALILRNHFEKKR